MQTAKHKYTKHGAIIKTGKREEDVHVDARTKMRTGVSRRVGQWEPDVQTGTSRLQEPTFLQQSSHLLVLPFTWLALETEVPELIAVVDAILIRLERLLQVGEHGRDRLEVVWLRLPSLDVLDDLSRLLSLTEVDHVAGQLVFRAVVDESQCSKVDA